MNHTTRALLDLYDATVDDVYRYASRLTGGDRARSEDLVQETYVDVLRRLRRGDELDLTTTYLIVACRSRFLDGIRADRRRDAREVRAANAHRRFDAVDAVGAAASRDDTATRALGALPDDQRAALVIRYVDDQPVAEVARLLGRSERAAESLLARARRALRDAVNRNDTGAR